MGLCQSLPYTDNIVQAMQTIAKPNPKPPLLHPNELTLSLPWEIPSYVLFWLGTGPSSTAGCQSTQAGCEHPCDSRGSSQAGCDPLLHQQSWDPSHRAPPSQPPSAQPGQEAIPHSEDPTHRGSLRPGETHSQRGSWTGDPS